MSTPQPDGNPILTTRRTPGQLGPVHVAQLLVVEIGVVGVLIAAGQSVIAALAAGVAAAALLLLVMARRKGRWWVHDRVVLAQFRRRTRGTDGAPPHPEPRLAALRTLAPGLAVQNIALAGGSSVGGGRDEGGWVPGVGG